MPARVVRLICAIAVALCWCSTSASLQTSASIEGVVVRYGTSEPISSVDVELVGVEGEDTIGSGMYSQGSLTITISRRSNDSRPQALRTRTKADGRFRFGDLKPGTYRLNASHQGGLYCPAEYGQKDWKGPGLDVVVSAGEIVRNANIEMIPPGTISGRVLDENGNPAGRVRVMAIDASWSWRLPIVLATSRPLLHCGQTGGSAPSESDRHPFLARYCTTDSRVSDKRLRNAPTPSDRGND
jgi:hypothetical protein